MWDRWVSQSIRLPQRKQTPLTLSTVAACRLRYRQKNHTARDQGWRISDRCRELKNSEANLIKFKKIEQEFRTSTRGHSHAIEGNTDEGNDGVRHSSADIPMPAESWSIMFTGGASLTKFKLIINL